ncbi:tripartite tricarboxylate transporter substrate binding protein [Variovorax sp. KK3]|uniref:Bug family tripartite tricarboxylate transporter substrate binding protein n=1 Tax=Variovorax sp. KK3 TaxID=1855728 RepID=UPI00097C7352|nr:tripartite tricarboxylate transporter substrate binding protein [Variovorax sp. KK3]
MTTRCILVRAAAVLAMACAAAGLHAQTAPGAQAAWPARPVRVLVPAGAGSGPDALCRQVTQRLGDQLGQPFTPDNRPGASGHVGAEMAARAAADGYTLVCGASSTFVTTPHLMTKLAYDPNKDLVPVAMLARAHLLLIASPGVPADDLPSLIAWIKSNPGKVSYASPGIGSNAHLAMEVFKAKAGLDMVHVPYNTLPALTDLSSGGVQLMIEPSASAIPFIRDGRVKLIAVASPTPLPEFPKARLTTDTVPGFEVIGWGGLFAPAATPRPRSTRRCGSPRCAMPSRRWASCPTTWARMHRVASFGPNTSAGAR